MEFLNDNRELKKCIYPIETSYLSFLHYYNPKKADGVGVTFDIIINHSFPKNFIEILQAAQKA